MGITVFSAQPRDLSTAVTLAQEADFSNERGAFAANYAKHMEENAGVKRGERQQGWRNAPHQVPSNSDEKKSLLSQGQHF